MMTKIFDVASMACESVESWVKSAKFGTGSDAAFVPANVTDGAFVTLGGLSDDTTYTGEKDWNVHNAYAPATAALNAEDVYVIDISGVQEGIIGGNVYKIGAKLVNLEVAAGYAVRARALHKGDKFWLGEGNFASAPTVGAYANLTAGDVVLTPAAATTAGQLNIAIRASKPMTIGSLVDYSAGNFEQEYLVEVL